MKIYFFAASNLAKAKDYFFLEKSEIHGGLRLHYWNVNTLTRAKNVGYAVTQQMKCVFTYRNYQSKQNS